MEENLRLLVDHRNEDLWRYILRNFKIKIEIFSKPVYITSFHEENITICVNKENLNAASFTHELLHLFLKSKKLFVANDLQNMVNDSPQLYYLFSNSLKQHIGNCLEHEKMLPLYLDRGFKRENFVGDYESMLMDEPELKELKTNFLQHKVYSRYAIDTFIGKFFSMKSSSNNKNDYSPYFTAFEELDKPLYNILEEFWIKWKSVSLEAPETYKVFLKKFLVDLVEWTEQRTII